jgi:hypothetical protein
VLQGDYLLGPPGGLLLREPLVLLLVPLFSFPFLLPAPLFLLLAPLFLLLPLIF